MIIRNAYFWNDYFKNIFIPQIDAFKSCLLSKLLPSFGNIESEAEKIAEDKYKRLCSLPATENGVGMADLAEKSRDEAIGYYCLMSNFKKGMTGFFCVGLYHLFEQQLFLFYRKEILKIEEENNIKLLEWGLLKSKFKEKNIALEDLNSYKKIDIIRLICNTFKHSEGTSAKELRKLKPLYFCYNDLISLPLVGEGLLIPAEDFIRYVKDVKDFWKELGSKMIQLN